MSKCSHGHIVESFFTLGFGSISHIKVSPITQPKNKLSTSSATMHIKVIFLGIAALASSTSAAPSLPGVPAALAGPECEFPEYYGREDYGCITSSCPPGKTFTRGSSAAMGSAVHSHGHSIHSELDSTFILMFGAYLTESRQRTCTVPYSACGFSVTFGTTPLYSG
ncbi:hypothetical protein O988_05552 [Pseudogymnoascus sp. VKM F-3808]|nr:hypothetical protein O988_05552 [Pseudogymnoascus sp. VKM F-3808]